MYDIDTYGSKSVIALIEQSLHTKFNILKAGAAKQTAPIFQCINTNSTEAAAKEFKRWSDNMQMGGVNNNAYEIHLFTNYSDNASKSKETRLPVKFVFCLLTNEGNKQNIVRSENPAVSGQQINASDMVMLIKQTIEAEMKAREESETSKRLKAIEERLLEEDEDEEEAINGGQNDLMAVLTQYAPMFAGALAGGAGKAPHAVNGTPDEKIKRINTAIQRLHKADPEIDSDLLKLADIAEQKPDQFKFLLNALRTM